MSEVKIEKLDFNYPVGGERLVKDASRNFDRTDYMLKNMEFNKAYIYKKSKNFTAGALSKILEEFKKRYIDYRKGWVHASDNYIPRDNFEEHLDHLSNPLSIDIETAAICDLACPQCSREYVITPDKLMNFDFYKKIIHGINLFLGT